MKLIALKPIYIGGVVVTEEVSFEALEQRGRELIQKGYAKLDENEKPEQPEAKADKKAKK